MVVTLLDKMHLSVMDLCYSQSWTDIFTSMPVLCRGWEKVGSRCLPAHLSVSHQPAKRHRDAAPRQRGQNIKNSAYTWQQWMQPTPVASSATRLLPVSYSFCSWICWNVLLKRVINKEKTNKGARVTALSAIGEIGSPVKILPKADTAEISTSLIVLKVGLVWTSPDIIWHYLTINQTLHRWISSDLHASPSHWTGILHAGRYSS